MVEKWMGAHWGAMINGTVHLDHLCDDDVADAHDDADYGDDSSDDTELIGTVALKIAMIMSMIMMMFMIMVMMIMMTRMTFDYDESDDDNNDNDNDNDADNVNDHGNDNSNTMVTQW